MKHNDDTIPSVVLHGALDAVGHAMVVLDADAMVVIASNRIAETEGLVEPGAGQSCSALVASESLRAIAQRALSEGHSEGHVDAAGGYRYRSVATADAKRYLVLLAQRERRPLLPLGSTDALTGLSDRRALLARVEAALVRGRGALLFADLDTFKAVNDGYGHVVGDRVLVEVAQRLCGAVRPDDMVARFGGDEFGIVLDDIVTMDDAMHVAARVVERMHEPIAIEKAQLRITVSIGVAIIDRRAESPDDLVHRADQAMYRAKAAGRDRLAE